MVSHEPKSRTGQTQDCLQDAADRLPGHCQYKGLRMSGRRGT